MAYGLSLTSFLRIIDSKGKESTINFNHPLSSDIGVLKTMIKSTAALVDALIRGQVIGAGIEFQINLAPGLGLKTSAVIGADIEEGVRFAFEATSGGQTLFRLPTVNETWLDGLGNLLVTPGDAVDDFIQKVIAGSTVLLSNARPSDAYGSDITTFLGGVESFLASSR